MQVWDPRVRSTERPGRRRSRAAVGNRATPRERASVQGPGLVPGRGEKPPPAPLFLPPASLSHPPLPPPPPSPPALLLLVNQTPRARSCLGRSPGGTFAVRRETGQAGKKKKVTEAPRGATKEPKQVESAVGGGACFPWGGQRRPPSEGVRSYRDVRTRSLPPSLPPPSFTLPHTPAKTATSQQVTPSCIQAEHLEVALPRSLPSRPESARRRPDSLCLQTLPRPGPFCLSPLYSPGQAAVLPSGLLAATLARL